MKIHTTQAGDRFLIDHITETTNWSQSNRRRIGATAIFTICGSAALALIIFLSLLIVR